MACSPFLVAAFSFVGDTWLPVGDWASIAYRTAEVGTRHTPLIGAYSTHGWAHPGPIVFWLASFGWRLSGGDARTLQWTATAINIGAVVAISVLVRRRGGLALQLTTMVFIALLAHGLGPGRITDIWNPLLPLFPFFLFVLLVWTAVLGERRAVIPALVLGALIGQAHVGFMALMGAVVLWAVVWSALALKGPPSQLRRPTDPWVRWRRSLLLGAGLGALTWVPPLLDQFFGSGNLGTVLAYFSQPEGNRVTFSKALGMVSLHLRPNGPWIGGPEPTHFASLGTGPVLPYLLVLSALAGLAVIAWRRRLTDVVALASLVMFLALVAVPIASRVEEPVFDYLLKWGEVLAALLWMTLAWSAWRIAEPWLRRSARQLIAAIAAGALVFGAAWSFPAAAELQFPGHGESPAVQSVRHQLRRSMDKGQLFRLEHRGDNYGLNGPGVIYWLIRDGYRVVTTDGFTGQKWGTTHIWREGQPYDVLLTVAVHYPGNYHDPVGACERTPGTRRLAAYDAIGRADRDWLIERQLASLGGPDKISSSDQQRMTRLAELDFRVGVFASRDVCAPSD